MGNMANEMAARMREDGVLPDPQTAGGAPGSEEGHEGAVPPPAAEPSTTDTGGNTPETIPYTRFKEVNDRLAALRPYETLQSYGYDPDSLGRLAAFETAYNQDPTGVWRSMADNLDLPQELKDALDQHLSGGSATPPPAQGEPPAADGNTPALPPEVQSRLEYVDRMRERDEAQAQQEALGRVTTAWDALDKQDGLEAPTDPEARAAYEHLKLMAIANVAGGSTQFRTAEELATEARRTILKYREAVLGDAIQRTGRGGLPPSLPGGPPAPSGAVNYGSDIRKATRAAEEAIKRGELPPIVR